MESETKAPRPFLLDLLILLAGISLVGFLITLIFSTVLLSNMYFIATVLCWLVAAVPIFGEIGGNTKVSFQARKDGKIAREVIAEREKAGKYRKGTRITFLYGIGGFLSLILAFLTL